ncbi:MAG: hypothetical protein MZW92_68550 [Comamonadaceae bacterium]|nr:hypothetical protein [Comamonadaceae bacterium]
MTLRSRPDDRCPSPRRKPASCASRRSRATRSSSATPATSTPSPPGRRRGRAS